MPAVARAALVSEPTAYRYFPDLASLLEEAFAGIEPDPAAAFAAGAETGDPVERVAYAAELLAKLVIERQSAIRALISVSITRGTARQVRPGYRFALIDQALAPLSGRKSGIDAATLEQLRRDLAVVISAEAVLTLVDLYDLDAERGGREHRAHRASHHRSDRQPATAYELSARRARGGRSPDTAACKFVIATGTSRMVVSASATIAIRIGRS